MDGAIMSSHVEEYDTALNALDAAKDTWAQTSIGNRIALLQQVKDTLMHVAQSWAETAARKKQCLKKSGTCAINTKQFGADCE